MAVSGGASPDVILGDTRWRNKLLDKYCRNIGRDLKTLRRSLLLFGSDARTVFDSPDAFKKVVRRNRGVGITEFIFYYPYKDEQIPIFKQIARDIIPKLRASARTS